MITKILFTIGVIAVVVFTSRYLSSRRDGGTGRVSSTRKSAAPVRLAAYTVIGILVIASALWIVYEWRSAHEIVRVRVVNSATGNHSTYEAYRSDVEKRSFRTIDGRRVNLAEVERLEVGVPDR
jgi:hypothetical protein